MKKYLIITILFSFISALTFASPKSTINAAAEKTFVKHPGQDRDRDRKGKDKDRRGREKREHRHHHRHHHGR
jgi:Ni/Co efflux regulator RcnB